MEVFFFTLEIAVLLINKVMYTPELPPSLLMLLPSMLAKVLTGISSLF